MSHPQQASARQFLTLANTLGVKLPKAVTAAVDLAETIRERVSRLPAAEGNALPSAVADALARGVDVATDPEVCRVIALRAIQAPNVLESVETASFMSLQDALREHEDAIVEELRKPFDHAAAGLVKAHERIGNIPLTDTARIVSKGGDIASVWAAAVEASKTIESVVNAWVSLGYLLRSATVDKRWKNLRLVDPTAAEFDDADLANTALDPWGAVLGGFELSLPTFGEYAERRDAIVQGRAETYERNQSSQRTKEHPSYLY